MVLVQVMVREMCSWRTSIINCETMIIREFRSEIMITEMFLASCFLKIIKDCENSLIFDSLWLEIIKSPANRDLTPTPQQQSATPRLTCVRQCYCALLVFDNDTQFRRKRNDEKCAAHCARKDEIEILTICIVVWWI